MEEKGEKERKAKRRRRRRREEGGKGGATPFICTTFHFAAASSSSSSSSCLHYQRLYLVAGFISSFQYFHISLSLFFFSFLFHTLHSFVFLSFFLSFLCFFSVLLSCFDFITARIWSRDIRRRPGRRAPATPRSNAPIRRFAAPFAPFQRSGVPSIQNNKFRNK